MAVPKRKTSKSRRNQRRAHDALKRINVIVDSTTGEYKLPHHVCAADGTYNSRPVIIRNDNNESFKDETQPETL